MRSFSPKRCPWLSRSTGRSVLNHAGVLPCCAMLCDGFKMLSAVRTNVFIVFIACLPSFFPSFHSAPEVDGWQPEPGNPGQGLDVHVRLCTEPIKGL